MTNRENYISIAKRQGYEKVPAEIKLCPILRQRFDEYVASTGFEYVSPWSAISDIVPKSAKSEEFLKYYPDGLKEKTKIDIYGVAYETGSSSAFHMTRMRHPMGSFDSVEQILEYPFPDFSVGDDSYQIAAIKKAHDADRIAMGRMSCNLWEISWYMRGMENLMADMMLADPMADVLLDKMTESAVIRARSYAKNGADVILLGDDIGMQRSIMMSEELYCHYLKPRMKRIIDAAKAVKPDVLIFYHSCGFVTPFIPHLIDVGVDVLDPVQPECMDFKEIHGAFSDRLSFHGTIGTQTTMPHGTPDDVRREVYKNLDIAGEKGGLFVCPTHLLEPDVPIENVVAYINACRDYTS